MPWSIDKQFSFCYGHRVWSQVLDTDYTAQDDTSCKCRHLHGHEGLVHVFLESNSLTSGMVTDFKHLGWLKNFIDDTLDHKFIIDINDPMYKKLVVDVFFQNAKFEYDNISMDWFEENCLKPVYAPGTQTVVGRVIDLSKSFKGADYEVLEGYIIVDFVPTSENLSKWLYEIVEAKMSNLGVKTKEIHWFETPKSRSIYRG